MASFGWAVVGSAAPAEAADPTSSLLSAAADRSEGFPLASVEEGPIVIESHDHSVDVDDPDLVAEMEAIHEEFEAGNSLSVALSTIEPDGLDLFQAAAVNTGMSITFDDTYVAPGNVQSVVLAAAAAWDNALATSPAGPVQIAVIWKNLGSPSLLGSAGPTVLYTHPQLPTSSYYPVPLANTLLDTDLRPGGPELVVNLNSSANWYVGTNTPGTGQVDLYSVVLHEIGHGLGFLGSGSAYNELPHTVPTLEAPTPFVFDHHVTHNGTPLLSQPDANAQLTSNNLWIQVSDHLHERLYAPGSWQEGSSFSHFDESTHPAGNPGALMTPSLASRETARGLDTLTLGVMARLGWPTRVGPATPTITSTSPGIGEITVSWGLDMAQAGVAPDGYRLEALLEGTPVASTVVPASASSGVIGGLVSGNIYTVRVVPLVDGIAGNPAGAVVDLASVPTTPRAVKAEGMGLSRTISWLPAPGAVVDHYEVQQSTAGGPWTAVGTTPGFSIGVNLTEGVHQFRVRGHNGNNAGTWGYSIPSGIAAGVERPVALDGQISRLYRAYFLRAPDAAGFTYWRDALAGGAGLAAVSSAFASSAEFNATYGALNDSQFVDLVYDNVLDRAPDPAGRAYWVNVLAAGAGRGQMMSALSESTEFVVKTGTTGPQPASEAEVYRLYVAFFLRQPDQEGLRYWTGQRAAGVPLSTIAGTFASSSEFQNTYGSLSNPDFVTLVYQNVLARNPDANGVAYWQWYLSTGADRGSMMTGFSQSQEFVIATGTVRS
jgi:hypothetical protein